MSGPPTVHKHVSERGGRRLEYFQDNDGVNALKVKPEVARLVKFSVGDITHAEAFAQGPFDVVFARNVFYLLNDKERKTAAENIRAALKPGGLVFVGGGFVQFNAPGFRFAPRTVLIRGQQIDWPHVLRAE